MNKLDLNFIQHRRVPWIAIAVLVLAVMAAAWQWSRWQALRTKSEQVEARIAALQHRLEEKRRAVAAQAADTDQRSAQRRKEEAKVLQALDYPWNRVFSTIEQASVENVAVLSFAHDAATANTRITLESTDVAGLVRFVEKMNGDGEDGPRGRWYLASYQLQPQNNPPTVTGVVLENR
jgi:Tfp pilus assembly protein PilE